MNVHELWTARRLRFLRLGEERSIALDSSILRAVSSSTLRSTTVCSGAGPTVAHQAGGCLLSQYDLRKRINRKSLRIRKLYTSAICSATLAAIAHNKGSISNFPRGSDKSAILQFLQKRKRSGLETARNTTAPEVCHFVAQEDFNSGVCPEGANVIRINAAKGVSIHSACRRGFVPVLD